MSLELWELVQTMERGGAELELALQCAPLIAGLKASNLLNIGLDETRRLAEILRGSRIRMTRLATLGKKTAVLLYVEERLESYLRQDRVKKFLRDFGYEDHALERILPVFRKRYQDYLEKKENFPHEMGVLLEYPIEDVEGFIKHNGKNFLCADYWKVYENGEAKRELFKRFERARETLIRKLRRGISMAQIIGEGSRCGAA